MGGWSDTDNKANLSPALLRYAANGVVTELGNKTSTVPKFGLGLWGELGNKTIDRAYSFSSLFSSEGC